MQATYFKLTDMSAKEKQRRRIESSIFIPTGIFRANYYSDSGLIGSISNDGRSAPWIFENQPSAFSYQRPAFRTVLLQKPRESYLTVIERITCVSIGGCGQAVDSRGQAVDN